MPKPPNFRQQKKQREAARKERQTQRMARRGEAATPDAASAPLVPPVDKPVPDR